MSDSFIGESLHGIADATERRTSSSDIGGIGSFGGAGNALELSLLDPAGSASSGLASDSDLQATLDGRHSSSNSSKSCASSLLPGPPHVKNIVLNELCERFSYYGLRAILVLYLSDGLGFSESDSIAYFSYSSSLAYFMPLLGGWVADTYLGKYRTILYFSGVYCLGGLVIALTAIGSQAWGVFLGLFLIAVGTGGIKPCVSSFGADQFPPSSTDEISSYFMVFYFCINLGSVTSFLLTPLLREHAGYPVAFGVPSLLLFVATLIFWSARNLYVDRRPTGSVLGPIMRVYWQAFRPFCGAGGERMCRGEVDFNIARASSRVSGEDVHNARALWRVLPVLSVLPAFWMLFDQQGSSWTLQAKSMDTLGFEPEQMGVVNPLLIMMLIPLFDRLIFPAVAKITRVTPLRKMGCGMIFTALSFVVSAMVQARVDAAEPNSVPILLQVPQILLISMGEICISVVGLEFAYSQAPARLKSLMTALFLLTTAIGDLTVGFIYNALSGLPRASMFLLFASMMMLNFLVFLWVASKFRPVDPATLHRVNESDADDSWLEAREHMDLPAGDHSTMDIGTTSTKLRVNTEGDMTRTI